MTEKKVRLACIASGSGTDFESIAKAWKAGWIPEVEEVVLISTKEGAGCLEKADKLGIKHEIVKPTEKWLIESELKDALIKLDGASLIFLVGCIFKVDFGLPMYNIHPADPHDHGGQGMYGLAVHEHVLNQIYDRVRRGWRSDGNKYYTYPTVHEVTPEYDKGNPLLRGCVEIPWSIITELIHGGGMNLKGLAERLQKYVLPYEWMLLPTAVRMAARKILEE